MDKANADREVDGVIITDELDRRPSRAPDYQAENQALASLAEAMSSNPDTVLQRLVETAVALTRCDSAGISLLETRGEQDSFRWAAATGAWAPYRDGTMPREESPCGEVIARQDVLLMKSPERVFPALLQADPAIAEGLLAPFDVDGKPAGTVWAIKHSPGATFEAEDARLLKSLARFASAAHQMTVALKGALGSSRESEARYRTLFDSMGQGFCIIEALEAAPGKPNDFRYLLANPAFERHTGMRNVVGKTIRELVPGAEPSIMDIYDEVVRTGERRRFEGHVAALDFWMEAEVFPTQTPGQIAVLFSDVSERRRTEAARRESEEQQAFFLKLSDALRPLSDCSEIKRAATQLLGEHLKVNRVFYADASPEGDHWLAAKGYEKGVEPLPDMPFPMAMYGQWISEDFRAGRCVIVRDMTTDARFSEQERAAQQALQIGGALAVPLVKNSVLVAMLALHDIGPRDWTDQELALAHDTAERTWAAVERARAETALRDSEERFRQFSDASTNVLWVRDGKTMEMTFASPAFETIYGIPGPARGGDRRLRTWARLIEPESRKAVFANFRRVRAGERIEMTFRIRRASDGALRWIHNSDFPLRDAAGKVQWIAGLGADITDAKEATDRQGVLVAELQHRTRNLIAVVLSLSERTLDNATSLEDFGKRFRLRLAALSRVQGLLSHLAAGERVAFDELLRSELKAHGATDGMASKVTLDGPAGVPLRSGAVQTFALALHELATNAVKYGVFAAPEGHLAVRWHVQPGSGDEPPRLHVDWQETGVVMPESSTAPHGGGYGRELIERALPYQLKAKTSYELGADGIHCTITVPISRNESKGFLPHG